MNKQCMKCGSINDNDFSFCTNCGAELTQVVVQQPIKQNVNSPVVPQRTDDSKGNLLGILSLVLYFGGSVILSMIAYFMPESIRYYVSSFSGLFPLAGIVIMIVGRIKYPKNTLLKVVMWIFISLLALGLILFILVAIFCFVTCSTMDLSGCS